MNLLNGQNILIAISVIAFIGSIAFSIGLNLRSGKKEKKKDDIDLENSAMTLQGNRIKVLEEALKEQQKINIETGNKLAAVEAVNVEKDKTIREYLAILQNRNPELDKVLSEILTFMKKINEHMETQNKDLKITGTVSH